jgi:nitroimidazol reductase NimA-like FMN-containing flavoprotein (pyridoxamine 5'-phosphate oxidase superfamily)
MPTIDHDGRHEALDEQECLRLLGTTRIGRLAYTQAALPAIRPVFYMLRDGAVEIPAQTGSALAVAVRGAVVAFEADSYEVMARTGWTVTIVGPSRVVTAGQSEDRDRCLIVVQCGLIQGWRMTLPVRPGDAVEPAHDTTIRT